MVPRTTRAISGAPASRLTFHHPILKLLACSDEGATLTKSTEPSVPSESILPPEWSLVSAENACEAVVYPPTPLSRLMMPVGSAPKPEIARLPTFELILNLVDEPPS